MTSVITTRELPWYARGPRVTTTEEKYRARFVCLVQAVQSFATWTPGSLTSTRSRAKAASASVRAPTMSAFTTTLLRAPLAPAVRVRVRATRRASRVARGRAATIAPRAGPDGIDRDDELNTGVLYERMKKLMETEKEETDAAVDAAIERQQAIEAWREERAAGGSGEEEEAG